MDTSFFVIGLGNPGLKYTDTRHNLGFWVVDLLSRRHRGRWSQPSGRYLSSRVSIAGLSVLLVEPLTYMNLSGEAVTELSRNFSLEPSELLVVCDDLALPLGSLRIRARGSGGGQKGLASIIRVVGSDEVPRVRLGIAGGRGEVRASDWSDYVLESFLPTEHDAVAEMVDRAATAVVHLLGYGVADAASRFNRRVKPA